jgi:DNA-binding XRE family transcriptional regulator
VSRPDQPPATVVYDRGAALELAADVRSPQERRAIVNVVSKLRELGEQLEAPHVGALRGGAAAGLWQLRRQRGASDWRLLYVRRGSAYVIVAIGRHDKLDATVARAQQRAVRHGDWTGREAMTDDPGAVADRIPHGFPTHDEILAVHVLADPELAEEWGRLGLARAVAVELIRFRSRHGLSQGALSELLGVSRPRIAELESGEKNPTVETIATIAVVTGLEFAIDIAPVGRAPRLVGAQVKASGAHVHRGASLLVAAR